MTSTRPARARRCLVVLVLTCLLALPLLLATSATRSAQASRPVQEVQRAQITFDSVDPALPTRDGRITLTGRVKNTTDEPISNLQVLLWRDQSPITTTGGLDAAITSDATTPYGARMVTEGAYFDITTDRAPTLAPGAEAPFTVSADVSSLELPSTSGVYLIGAHALGQVGNEGIETLGRNRLLMPLADADEPPEPTPVVDVVVLSAQPTWTGSGEFVDDSLTDQLADGGRLRQLLQVAARDNTSWIIDPALFAAVTRMADGYTVLRGEARGQRVARAWLREFEALNRAQGFRGTYGLPDASAIARTGHAPAIWKSVHATDAGVEGLADLPLIAISGDGRVDAAGVALLEQDEPLAVLASTPESRHTLLQPLGNAPVVNFDPDTFAGGPGPLPATTMLHRRQRLLATSWVDAAEGVTEPRVRVITTGPDAAAVLGADAPWIRHQTLRNLLAGERFEWSQSLAYTAEDTHGESLEDPEAGVGDVRADYAAVASMMAERSRVDIESDRAMATMASSWWRGRVEALAAYSDTVSSELSDTLSGDAVSLAVSPSVTMLAKDGGFPASIQNHLDQPIVVSLHFTSAQPQRLSVPSQTDIRVPANSTTTLDVRPEAAANGPVQVSAQLTTPNGRSLGPTTPILVNATNLGAVGWIIVGASGIVLIATTALRIRQVRRDRSDLDVVPAALPSGPTSDPDADGAALESDVEVADGRRHPD